MMYSIVLRPPCSFGFVLKYNTQKIEEGLAHSQALASSPGHSQILSRSRGEKSGEGLGSKIHHGPEMVESVS